MSETATDNGTVLPGCAGGTWLARQTRRQFSRGGQAGPMAVTVMTRPQDWALPARTIMWGSERALAVERELNR